MKREDLERALDSVLGNRDGELTSEDALYIVFRVLGYFFLKR